MDDVIDLTDKPDAKSQRVDLSKLMGFKMAEYNHSEFTMWNSKKKSTKGACPLHLPSSTQLYQAAALY